MLPDLVQNGEHGDVGLACTRGSTNKHVLISVICRLKYDGLDPVQSFHIFKHQLPNLEKKERQRMTERKKNLYNGKSSDET